MAGMVCTVTEVTFSSVKKITWSWTSDNAAGTASGATTAVLDGKLIAFMTIPGAGGDAPTDNYDVTLTDADSHDVLCGAGANRDTANTEVVAEASLGAVSASTLTLNVSNAGNSKKGVAVAWIR